MNSLIRLSQNRPNTSATGKPFAALLLILLLAGLGLSAYFFLLNQSASQPPTPTATPTPTPTPDPTNTPTATPTCTPTHTATATPTNNNPEGTIFPVPETPLAALAPLAAALTAYALIKVKQNKTTKN